MRKTSTSSRHMACLPNYAPPNVAYTPSEKVNNSTPILIESQQPQFDHHALINAKIIKKLGQIKRVRMKEKPMLRLPFLHGNFPLAKQCHYSANISPSHYPPPSLPQRPSLNQPQCLSTTLPIMNTTFSTNQNTNKKEFCSKKPVGFTQNSVVIC